MGREGRLRRGGGRREENKEEAIIKAHTSKVCERRAVGGWLRPAFLSVLSAAQVAPLVTLTHPELCSSSFNMLKTKQKFILV